jgi:hypothetical protein
MKKYRITEDTFNWYKRNKNNFDAFDLLETMMVEDYPSSWNMEEFKSLTSFRKRIAYCEEHLQRISSGSSRIAYKIDEQKVLKLAKNRKGLAQNDVEVSASRDSYFEDIFAEVFDYDAHDLWLEMELARKVTKPKFQQITGISFDDYSNMLRQQHENNNPSRWGRTNWVSDIDEDTQDKIWENELFSGVVEYMNNYAVPVGDLVRTSSYGIVKRSYGDDIVLIDYGLSQEVYDSYYS